ncbi:unnamed protein product [Prunus armeniaca]|uniref:Uncharacterized protein n=1 Tax=Prunus armeniaca TaxID=36596 RepID=A0A6J5V2C2_PRUAR|nr:unnamed protein product [Prunus armeniaca]
MFGSSAKSRPISSKCRQMPKGIAESPSSIHSKLPSSSAIIHLRSASQDNWHVSITDPCPQRMNAHTHGCEASNHTPRVEANMFLGIALSNSNKSNWGAQIAINLENTYVLQIPTMNRYL